ncbi:hypothetical protein GOZ78_23850 [Agrobacterium vitis]|uniref:Uncharacterized protein n=1 Tax=Agrobacterium vitis TaxID=373 RepID=A0ABD6GF80_AGRVI|nr:hypothetical protein [Agrobacterium vitis]MUO82201.1 hypothetical protein [Agrobacterium vitis]MUO97601.1 hypothetical protein [Agrobacterium vitis]MUP08128.1 hypothetical protein [Agrobacterium vitis]MUZ85397.1 hypothetical protein [Agrobacterium vitis]MVA13041.1 hypothetical protein [Agrobacterium vitis]
MFNIAANFGLPTKVTAAIKSFMAAFQTAIQQKIKQRLIDRCQFCDIAEHTELLLSDIERSRYHGAQGNADNKKD